MGIHYRFGKKTRYISTWLLFVMTTVIIVISACAIYIIAVRANDRSTSQTTTDDLSTALSTATVVSRIITLPQGETPLLIDIKDAEQTKSIQFLSEAKTGDKVLIYQKAKKGYIYRPSTRQIIASGPVELQ